MTPPVPSLASRVLHGAATMMLLRWATRMLGLISITITARLLIPEDFGVVGTASLVVGFLLRLSDGGMGEALVRALRLDPGKIDTMWTLRLLISACLCAALYLPADVFAHWLSEPRVGDILRVMAFIPLIEALSSPVVMLMVRDMEFKRLFYLRVSVKFTAVCSTVILALTLQDYWALVWGQVAGALALVVISQWMLPHRPRLTLSAFSELGGFTFWSLLRDLAAYFADTCDELVVRVSTGTHQFALYHASRDLSRILISEIVALAGTPLFSAFAKLQEDRPRLTQAATNALGGSALLLAAASILVAHAAAPLVHILLGAQWLEAIPLLQFVALAAGLQTLALMNRGLYAILDKQHLAVAVWFTRAAVLATAAWMGMQLGGLVAVAQALAAANLVVTFLDLWLVYHLLGARYPVLTLYLTPLLALGLSHLALLQLPHNLPGGPIVDLALTGLVGAGTFIATVFVVWRLRGRPAGPERALIERLPSVLRTRLLDVRA